MKIIIDAGLEWNGDFTFTEDGLVPINLDPNDTAYAIIQTAGVDPKVVIDHIDMAQVDPDNGRFGMVIPADKTELLEQDVGFAEDKYPSQIMYTMIIFASLASGNQSAEAPIYIRKVAKWVPPIQPVP